MIDFVDTRFRKMSCALALLVVFGVPIAWLVGCAHPREMVSFTRDAAAE